MCSRAFSRTAPRMPRKIPIKRASVPRNRRPFLCKSGESRNFFGKPTTSFVQNHERLVLQTGTFPGRCRLQHSPSAPGEENIGKTYIIRKIVLFIGEKPEKSPRFCRKKETKQMLRRNLFSTNVRRWNLSVCCRWTLCAERAIFASLRRTILRTISEQITVVFLKSFH